MSESGLCQQERRAANDHPRRPLDEAARIRLLNLKQYRRRDSEVLRTSDLTRLTNGIDGRRALDVGARDGHFSEILVKRFESVVALDLVRPEPSHPRIDGVVGDVTRLALADDSFDLVACTEVLEHIAPSRLADACAELARVTRRYLLIGVPFKQDIRVGRTTCPGCRTCNPPWGHVNVFDEKRLLALFAGLSMVEASYVGINGESTNGLSRFLMDLAGNPYGTYGQDEPCVACGAALRTPLPRTLFQKICTKAAFFSRRVTEPWHELHANWIHLLLKKA